MVRIVILTLPAYGHINPTLRMARELIDRDHEVAYYLPDRFVDVIESTGATFQRLSDEFDMMRKMREQEVRPGQRPGSQATDEATDADREREEAARLMKGSIDAAPAVADRVVASDPDAIVYDPMCPWGREAVDRFQGPSVAFYTSFALREESPLLDRLSIGSGPAGSLPKPLVTSLEKQGVSDPGPADLLVASADRSVVPIPRTFQPDHEAFGEDHVFAGPMIRAGDEQRDAGLPLSRLEARQSVYVSLGTIAHGDETFFEACFDAFADTDWELVVKSKTDADRLDDTSPANVSVRRRVPQLDLLERVDVFVTHGGMNSTMEALSFGTPLVVVPQMADQYVVAERVTELGLGETLETETLTADSLYEAVETTHRTHTEPIERFRTTIREAGGATRAATAVESLVKRSDRASI